MYGYSNGTEKVYMCVSYTKRDWTEVYEAVAPNVLVQFTGLPLTEP